jgi:hypothetical protein
LPARQFAKEERVISSHWNSNDSIRFSSVLYKVVPVGVHDDRLTPSNDKQKVFGTSQRNVHTANVGKKPNTFTTSGANRTKDYNRCLSSCNNEK